jgi:hypothetical protein
MIMIWRGRWFNCSSLGLAAGLVFRVTSDRTEADRYLTVEDK